ATVAGLAARVGGLETEFSGLKAGVAVLTATVAGLKTEVAGLAAGIGCLETEVAGLAAKVEGLETGVAGLAARVGGLETGGAGRRDEARKNSHEIDISIQLYKKFIRWLKVIFIIIIGLSILQIIYNIFLYLNK
ncbi:MAG: hypothetical protein LBW85_08025, partial [Deltaproteobacteria bacterium]|nr:hypothetical protein [Deltaproteobacteria bacterium]